MKILGENNNNDLFIGTNNQLVVRTGIDAVVQASKSAIEAQRGEMQFATNRGIPTDQTLWSGTAEQQQFQFYCRQALVRLPDVVRVSSFITTIADNTLSYEATIITVFSSQGVSFNGSI